MITQAQADALLAQIKEAVSKETFAWFPDTAQNEDFVAVGAAELQFILKLKRNPFEITLHFRTKDRHIGLARLDNAYRHVNPDGTEIVGRPHLHWYREGHELAWAEPVDWCDLGDPARTLEAFLALIRARFANGVSVAMV